MNYKQLTTKDKLAYLAALQDETIYANFILTWVSKESHYCISFPNVKYQYKEAYIQIDEQIDIVIDKAIQFILDNREETKSGIKHYAL